MSEKNSGVSLNLLIIFLVGFLVLILVGIFLYKYSGGLNELVQDNVVQKSAFYTYDVQKKVGGGVYMVQFKDLITTAGKNSPVYYRYDLTVETEDKKSVEDMIKVRRKVIAVINGVMSSFHPDDLNTEAERTRVKKIIQSEVTGHYPNLKVKDIYFENFLYN